MSNEETTAVRHENLVGKIAGWVKRMIAEHKARKIAERGHALEDECKRELQVREWNGGLYICYNDIPIIHREFLKEDPEPILRISRESLKQWKEGRR